MGWIRLRRRKRGEASGSTQGRGKITKKKAKPKKTHRIDPWGLGVFITREGNRVDSFRFEIVCVSNFFSFIHGGEGKKN